jgi:hypothetical protein
MIGKQHAKRRGGREKWHPSDDWVSVFAGVAQETGLDQKAIAVAMEAQFVWAREEMGTGLWPIVTLRGFGRFIPMTKNIGKALERQGSGAAVVAPEPVVEVDQQTQALAHELSSSGLDEFSAAERALLLGVNN